MPLRDLELLIDEVVELACSAMLRGDALAPFAHVAYGRRTTSVLIAADDPHRVAEHGRRTIRATARGADAYAMVYEAYLRDADGGQRDAIVVEAASAADGSARCVALPLGRSGRSRTPTGERRDLAPAPSALVPFDPLQLDWGTLSADATGPTGAAIYFVLHQLESPDAAARSARFMRARLRCHRRAGLPPAQRQEVVVDDRGQELAAELRRTYRAWLRDDARAVRFLGER